MEITEEMVAAAMKKAVGAGLFPRRSEGEDLDMQKEIMAEILEAALAAQPFLYGMLAGADSRSGGHAVT